jgi:hypothetical protein
MNSVSNFIRLHSYTILSKYSYFNQNKEDDEHYIGGNISKTTYIINKLKLHLEDTIKIIDINDELGIVIFRYINTGRTGSICEIKNFDGYHRWLVNLFMI